MSDVCLLPGNTFPAPSAALLCDDNVTTFCGGYCQGEGQAYSWNPCSGTTVYVCVLDGTFAITEVSLAGWFVSDRGRPSAAGQFYLGVKNDGTWYDATANVTPFTGNWTKVTEVRVRMSYQCSNQWTQCQVEVGAHTLSAEGYHSNSGKTIFIGTNF